MNKDFTKHNQALALEELGFDEPVINVYDLKSKELVLGEDDEMIWAPVLPNNGATIAAPLHQQAFRWFREKHKLHSTITSISQESWQWHITKPGESLGKLYNEDFYTYEEAESACLDKLIEITKNK